MLEVDKYLFQRYLRWFNSCRNTRYCDEDVIVEGMKIPKGAHIDIPVYGLTRDPEYWDEPLIIQTAQVRSKPQQVSDR